MPTRRAVTGLLALTLVPLAGERAHAQSEPDLRIITTGNDGAAGVFYAQALGTFKKYGLTAQIQMLNSGEAAAAAVVGGAADIGVSNALSFAVAHARGVGLTLLAPASLWTSAEPSNALLVAGDSPLRTARDMTGKTIGVPAINDLNSTSAKLWLDKNGGDSSSVRLFELPTAQSTAAVQNRTIDAAMIAAPALTVALNAGLRVLAYPYGSIAARFCINAWYAKKEFVANRRDAARRFAAAVGEAQAWANRNHAASAKIVADVSKIDLDVLLKMTRAVYAERFEPGLLQPVIDLAARYRLVGASFPATDLYERF